MDTDPYVLYQPQQNNARNAHQKSQTFYLPSVVFYESPYRFVRRSESEGIPPIYIYITYIYIYYSYIYIYYLYIIYCLYIYISHLYIYISMCYCYCHVNGTMIINHGYMFLYPFFFRASHLFSMANNDSDAKARSLYAWIIHPQNPDEHPILHGL